jgi:hypothetical protein
MPDSSSETPQRDKRDRPHQGQRTPHGNASRQTAAQSKAKGSEEESVNTSRPAGKRGKPADDPKGNERRPVKPPTAAQQARAAAGEAQTAAEQARTAAERTRAVAEQARASEQARAAHDQTEILEQLRAAVKQAGTAAEQAQAAAEQIKDLSAPSRSKRTTGWRRQVQSINPIATGVSTILSTVLAALLVSVFVQDVPANRIGCGSSGGT